MKSLQSSKNISQIAYETNHFSITGFQFQRISNDVGGYRNLEKGTYKVK